MGVYNPNGRGTIHTSHRSSNWNESYGRPTEHKYCLGDQVLIARPVATQPRRRDPAEATVAEVVNIGGERSYRLQLKDGRMPDGFFTAAQLEPA